MLRSSVIFLLFLHVFALPENENKSKIIENELKTVEQEIVFNEAQHKEESSHKILSRSKRQHGKVNEERHWPNATVPLYFDPEVMSNTQLTLIM
jgi:hypothetical protein